MVMANSERVSRALDLLRDGLAPKCAATWEGFYGPRWLEVVNGQLHTPEPNPRISDVAFLFKGMKGTWNEVFGHGFTPAVRSLVFELAEVRNRWAHQETLSSDDVARALDSMERVLEAFGNTAERHRDPGAAPGSDAADVRGGVPCGAPQDGGEADRGSAAGGSDAVAGDHHAARRREGGTIRSGGVRR